MLFVKTVSVTVYEEFYCGFYYKEVCNLLTLQFRMPYSELERIAEKHGSMPALLIDEINQAAMETIGDLMIDGDDVAEEYSGYLEALKKA